MRHLSLFKNGVKFKLFLIALATLIRCNWATLYPFGSETEDLQLDYSTWESGSVRINLEYEVPILGDGFITRIWVN